MWCAGSDRRCDKVYQNGAYARPLRVGFGSDETSSNSSGPLSTMQTPGMMPFHHFGSLPGTRPTPPSFNQTTSATSESRQRYLRTFSQPGGMNTTATPSEPGSSPSMHIWSSGRNVAVSTHISYVKPMDSSMRTQRIKDAALGKSEYKVGLPQEALLSNKGGTMPHEARQAFRRVRSSGSVAPRKKGSIYNTSLRHSGLGSWGSIPRQNY